METLDYTWYQEAAYTSCMKIPVCFSNEYLDPEYISEVGEFAGKIAKKIRGDVVQDEDIILELGDCAWMLAVKARLHNVKLIFDPKNIPKFLVNSHFEESLLKAFLVQRSPQYQWLLLKHTCESLGFPFDEVLKMNIKKIKSRQKRKVVQGNGDYR